MSCLNRFLFDVSAAEDMQCLWARTLSKGEGYVFLAEPKAWRAGDAEMKQASTCGFKMPYAPATARVSLLTVQNVHAFQEQNADPSICCFGSTSKLDFAQRMALNRT